MNQIIQAAKLLQAGELVAFPTETVYGLGADATNPSALRKIFALKGRPTDHPLIVHLANVAKIMDWVADFPKIAQALAATFWPGPLTLILPVAAKVSPLITGGQSTIGIRIPHHPIALDLLNAFDGAIAAPSANRFGRISPTTAAHVKAEFIGHDLFILDGHQCQCGLESTIIDVTRPIPQLLRPGPLTPTVIMQLTGIQVKTKELTNHIRVSGQLLSHYAPQTPVKLLNLAEIIALLSINEHLAVMSFTTLEGRNCIKMSNQSEQYAHDLYFILRQLDALQMQHILIELPPNTSEWQTIHDRLRRASAETHHKL